MGVDQDQIDEEGEETLVNPATQSKQSQGQAKKSAGSGSTMKRSNAVPPPKRGR